jgi:dipeptidyl aminopeptidase/acylaminoacyl peptidase
LKPGNVMLTKSGPKLLDFGLARTLAPDGRHFFYNEFLGAGNLQLAVGSLDDEKATLLPGGPFSRVRYAPPGHVLFVREGTLMAQPFDARRRVFTGDPVPVADGVPSTPNGSAEFSVSTSGVLVYQRGRSGELELAEFERDGRRVRTLGPSGDIQNPVLSPDGRRIAMRRRDPQSRDLDVWTLDVERGTLARFTFDPESDSAPLWSPDGQWIAFNSDRDSLGADIYRKRASGVGGLELLVESANEKFPTSWSADGRYLVYWERVAGANLDIFAIDVEGERKPIPLVTGPGSQSTGMLSPDGRWLAYTSSESGRPEIYVQGFPEAGGKWQVSLAGGTWPAWRGDSRELYFVGSDQRLMAVAVGGSEGFEAGIPAPLFTLPQIGQARNRYDVSRDGRRFIAHVPVGFESIAPFDVVVNWQKRIAR